jgi:hypothetical protein
MNNIEELAKEIAEHFIQHSISLGIKIGDIKSYEDTPNKYKKVLIFIAQYILDRSYKGELK